MKRYQEIETETPEKFKQMTGLSQENFQSLCNKTETYIEEEKKRNPLKQRGLKKSKLSLEDCILLTIYYLRHYPTFINLADVFEISESYCHKIYSRYSRILAQAETLPNRKNLLENPPDTIIIDVTEQPIERPVKGQKPYYSGKTTFEVQVFFQKT
ncbi:MAG: transposase family protein [Thiomargarita sp.]|nr:transposase family protein [Thiomargarita sp.]